jgi:hypothetical protein
MRAREKENSETRLLVSDRIEGIALVIEPRAHIAADAARGLATLGYQTEHYTHVEDVPWACGRRWQTVLISPTLADRERSLVKRHLETLGEPLPVLRLLRDSPNGSLAVSATQTDANGTDAKRAETWSETFRVRLLRWTADQGPSALRPEPQPQAPFGHAYPAIEQRFQLGAGQATRVLEDLADFGALSRRLANRVHLCPNCRRWTIILREACPTCSSLDVAVESVIHHFACAHVGLDSEFRHGAELKCPKCGKMLRHIGLDYERPHETYVCRTCEQLFEDPQIATQCLHCRWDGAGSDVLSQPIYEYELTARGHEAVQRGELSGLKLRETIRNARFAIATREFLELEVERELFRLNRYRRPLAVLLCQFLADDAPHPLFREADPDLVADLSQGLLESVRSLDVVAMFDATSIAVLLPETDETQMQTPDRRLRDLLGGYQFRTAGDGAVATRWHARAWSKPVGSENEPLQWCRQTLQEQHERA